LSAATPLVAGGAASAPLLVGGCFLDCAFLSASSIFFFAFCDLGFLVVCHCSLSAFYWI